MNTEDIEGKKLKSKDLLKKLLEEGIEETIKSVSNPLQLQIVLAAQLYIEKLNDEIDPEDHTLHNEIMNNWTHKDDKGWSYSVAFRKALAYVEGNSNTSDHNDGVITFHNITLDIVKNIFSIGPNISSDDLVEIFSEF